MEQPRREPDLYDSCRFLISESRLVRAELDKAWGTYLSTRLRTNGFCLSLLDEATARLAAQEQVRAERAHRVLEDLF